MFTSDRLAAPPDILPLRNDAPRVIQQFTAVFLVSGANELWRVYDCDVPEAAGRQMPSPSSTSPHRVFVALARTNAVRVHTFAADSRRDIDAASLQQQLDESIGL